MHPQHNNKIYPQQTVPVPHVQRTDSYHRAKIHRNIVGGGGKNIPGTFHPPPRDKNNKKMRGHSFVFFIRITVDQFTKYKIITITLSESFLCDVGARTDARFLDILLIS